MSRWGRPSMMRSSKISRVELGSSIRISLTCCAACFAIATSSGVVVDASSSPSARGRGRLFRQWSMVAFRAMRNAHASKPPSRESAIDSYVAVRPTPPDVTPVLSQSAAVGRAAFRSVQRPHNETHSDTAEDRRLQFESLCSFALSFTAFQFGFVDSAKTEIAINRPARSRIPGDALRHVAH